MKKTEKMALEKEKPEVLAYMVDAKYCKGCIYYGYIAYSSGRRACDYTYQTGKLRIGDTAHCQVRKTARRKKGA